VLGVGIAAVAAALLGSWRRRAGHADLGVVSSQWIAEQRMMQGPARRR
jgi:hypothetical protein